MIISQRVHYRGRVQGVGFRMTAQRIATKYAVTGYVKNLADGQVEILVTGEPDEIDRFLVAVATRMADYIQHQDIQGEPVQSFTHFEIRI
jgi:acylphosphatase